MPNEFPKTLMAAALSAAFPGVAAAQTAARVDFASGPVTAVAPNGQSRTLTRGSEVRVGETVSTQNGRAQMRFTDGAYVSLQPQTDFKIENYVFEGRGSPNESVVMSLLKGGMRTITGLVGRTNRDGYRLQTQTATIGIRGTEYSIAYDAGGSVTMFVAGGATTVTNQTGTTVVPSGRSASVGGQNSPPSQTNEKPFLPPEGSGNTNVAGPTNPTQDATAQLPSATLLTGEVVNSDSNVKNLAYVYESYGNINVVAAQPATLNSAGILTSYMTSSMEGPETSGTAQLSLAGNDGVIAWGRWIGGITGQGVNLVEGGPLHWVVGVPVTNMPTSGEATYSAIGATATCMMGCSSAAVTSASLTVNFGTGSGTYATGMLINGMPNNFSGGLGLYGNRFTASGSYGGLSFEGQGFFAGPAASRAGMAYNVYGSVYEGPTTSINGVIAYKKAGAP
ncbi:MAG: FecR domain-containing protein [Burkholderiales bacterium]